MSGTASQAGWAVEARGLTRAYRRGRETIQALAGVDVAIGRGEFVAVVGPSGAGKTTLLNLLGCMDTPTTGTLRIDGRAIEGLREAERTRFRQRHVGFVFQHFGLIPTLTVAENVALPLLFARRRDTGRVEALLAQVGLQHRRGHRPHELSGGEMQRVAIARALINEPVLLLADEPTGNLDSATGEEVVRLFQELHGQGLTIIVVTHNPRLAAAAGRELRLQDGRLSDADAARASASGL